MGCSSGPDIIQDGLVLCLDAGSKRSYPGTGTTWSDLSGNGNNASLLNTPSFDTENSGGIGFDSSNNYALVSQNFQPARFTLGGWINVFGTLGGLQGFLSNRDMGGDNIGFVIEGDSATSFSIYIRISNSWASLGNIPITYNQPTYLLWSYDESSIKAYKDGELYSSKSQTGSVQYSNSNDFYIAAQKQGASIVRPIYARIHSVSLYNRALTADEVRQNYLATKERYA